MRIKDLSRPGGIILIILFALRFVPFFFRDARLWGFNHLTFLPTGYIIFFAVVSVAAILIMSLPFARSWSNRLIDCFSKIFYDSRRKYLNRFIFIAVIGAIFIIFAARTYFLGDGYTILSHLSSPVPTIYKWSEQGVTVIIKSIMSLLGGRDVTTVQWTFRIIASISGMLAVWFFFLIAGLPETDNKKRFLIFITSLLGGHILLFFGSVENYSLLWIGLAGFVYYGWKYSATGQALFPALLFMLFGIFIHLQSAIMIPAFVYLVLCRGKGHEIYQRYKMIFAIAAGLLMALGVIIFIQLYTNNLYFEHIFLPPFSGKPSVPDYAIFSLSHLGDCLNQLILLSPLLPLLIILLGKNIKSVFKDRAAVFLALLGAASLLFLLVIDPKLAMARDYDLLSLSAFGFTLFLIALSGQKESDSLRGLYLPVAIYLIVAVVPYLMTNLDRTRSEEYMKYIIRMDPDKSAHTVITMRDYYRREGDIRQADSLNNLYGQNYPNLNRMFQAGWALENNDFRKAARIAETITPDRFSPVYHNLLSMLALHRGDYNKALEESDKTIQLGWYNVYFFQSRAMIFAFLKDYDRAIEALNIGATLDSLNPGLLEGFASIYLLSGKLDLSAIYASKMITADSGNAVGYYLLSKINAMTDNLPEARKYLDLYLKHGLSDPNYVAHSSELTERIRQMPETGN